MCLCRCSPGSAASTVWLLQQDPPQGLSPLGSPSCVPTMLTHRLVHSFSADSAELCMGAIAADKVQAASVSFASTRTLFCLNCNIMCISILCLSSTDVQHSLCPDCSVDNLGGYMYAVPFWLYQNPIFARLKDVSTPTTVSVALLYCTSVDTAPHGGQHW